MGTAALVKRISSSCKLSLGESLKYDCLEGEW